MFALAELQARKVAEKERKKETRAHHKQEKYRLKSLAKDKNPPKSLALMETVNAGDNGAIVKIKRNDYVLLLRFYYRIDDFDSKMKIAALGSI